MSSALNQVIPCVVSGLSIEGLLALLEPACEKAPVLSWDADRTRTLGSIVIRIRHSSIVSVEISGSRKPDAQPACIYLDRADIGSDEETPNALLLSWRDSLRAAVRDDSEEARDLIARLDEASRCLVAAGVAAGLANPAACAFSTLQSNNERFHLRTSEHLLAPTPRLLEHLEMNAPRFRYVDAPTICSISGVFPSPLFRRTTAYEIEAIEILRLVAETPTEAIMELTDALQPFLRKEEGAVSSGA